jgi:hypothetical protein
MQLFSEQECRPRSGSEEAVLIGRILAGRKDLFDELLKPHLAPLSRVVQAKWEPTQTSMTWFNKRC